MSPMQTAPSPVGASPSVWCSPPHEQVLMCPQGLPPEAAPFGQALRRRRHAAAAHADQLKEGGDWEGAATWHRILNAIEQLQATKPSENEQVELTA
jgi:hypothetical protein